MTTETAAGTDTGSGSGTSADTGPDTGPGNETATGNGSETGTGTGEPAGSDHQHTGSFTDALSQAVVSASGEANYAVEFSILDTRDQRSIAETFAVAIERALSTSPAQLLFYKVSSGIVLACTLADGRSVVLKAHQGDRTMEGLSKQRLVQQAALQAGMCAPEPLLGPHTFGSGHLTIDSFVSVGVPANTLPLPVDAPKTWTTLRRLLAEQLIAISQLPTPASNAAGPTSSPERTMPSTNRQAGSGAPASNAVGPTSSPADQNHCLTRISLLAPDSIYPVPHSPLFDFAKTAPGAEWIDAIATTALSIIHAVEATEPLPAITTHCDLRAENVHVSVDGSALAAIWDWDSIETASEAWHVGTSARAFSLDFSRDNGTCTDIGIPTVGEMLAFIADCQTARGRDYSHAEHQATVAWMHHALAYSARCEHALLSAGIPVRWTPTFADRLRELQAANLLS